MDETADRWWPVPNSPPPKPKSFLVKLKISKSRNHVCYFCNKEFSNGKALGGHIRIHMNQKRKKRTPNNPIPEFSDSVSELEEENRKIVKCFLCGKEFGSEKSLFGHMRNHPGRGWRGIKPPVSEKNSCCSSVSENELAAEVAEPENAAEIDDQMSCAAAARVDLFKSFSKWSYVTVSEEITPPKSADNEIPEAAYTLMLLSRSKDEVRSGYRKVRGAEGAARMLDFDLNEPFVPSLNQV